MTQKENVTILDIGSYASPPEPTAKNPHAQIIWIFKKREQRALTKSTQLNYRYACSRYIEYVISENGYGPYFLQQRWDEFALLRYKDFLLSKNENGENVLSSYTRAGQLSCVRQVMNEAFSYGILKCTSILNAALPESTRETESHTDYSENELDAILEATTTELRATHKVLHGYTPLAPQVGRDPRIRHPKGAKAGYGWKVEDNARWYFENVLDKKAISNSPAHVEHRTFFMSLTNYHGGLNKAYNRWGTTPLITLDLLMPLVVRLEYLTGINPGSLLDLKIDCYHEEHPITGMPYLFYYKERSQGEMVLHAELLETPEILTLKRKQASLIKNTLSNILSLTQSTRARLGTDDPLRNKLLIYESAHRGAFGTIISLSSAQTSRWCRKMAEKYNLLNDDGSVLDFNLVRFRSTKLTEMALQGRDLFEIKQVAGHKNVRTTIRYLNAQRLDNPVREVVANALQTIRDNRIPDPFEKQAQASATQPIHVFKGILSDCKNVFDPPERIKKSSDYIPGHACTRFNMCLFCKNVIVMREHLPTLAAYRTQIVTAQANNIQNLPHAHLYDDTLELLDNIFNPETSEFSKEDIDWAYETSELVDVIIDPMLYHGVEEWEKVLENPI